MPVLWHMRFSKPRHRQRSRLANRSLFGALALSSSLALPTYAQQMRSFDLVSQQGAVVVIRVPSWMNGPITSDSGIEGSVKRRSLGRSEAISLFGLTLGGGERFGRYSFTISTPEHRGTIAGDCVYDRTERRLGIGALTISQPLRPMVLKCRFLSDGELIGRLELQAGPRTSALVQSSRRSGRAEIYGTSLSIESEHRLRGSEVPVDNTIGYRMLDKGQAISVVDLTDFTKRSIALPASGPPRLAAIVAAVALSSFWDPGDTDD